MGNISSIPNDARHTIRPEPTPSSSAAACPIDPEAREAWMAAAIAARKRQEGRSNNDASPDPDSSARSSPFRPPKDLPRFQHSGKPPLLDQERVTSSIPRAMSSPPTTTPSPSSPKISRPSIGSTESDPSTSDSSSSNWVYPSEHMFFNAMLRKNHQPTPEDMRTIVPIHNAVNERAWAEILAWERSSPRAAAANRPCGGPRLRAFSGDSSKRTPRALWNSLLGYETPFDRHDWVVERCGKIGTEEKGQEIEYVIDFYRGKSTSASGGLNFYLDVRPKLNSWEGWRMRMGRMVGL